MGRGGQSLCDGERVRWGGLRISTQENLGAGVDSWSVLISRDAPKLGLRCLFETQSHFITDT